MSGHGHVTPNPDGSKARCGGPRICAQCSKEAAVVRPQQPKLPPPATPYQQGYQDGINMILTHCRTHGHQWTQALGFPPGTCDGCYDGEEVPS